LAEAVTPANRAKTFAMHRVGDTLGAIIGPILAALFINQFPSSMFEDPTYNYRILFLLTAIPAILSALAFALAVPEKKRLDPPKHKLWAVLGLLPMPLKRWLIGVGVFGIGDFSHTLLIVAAGQLLTPSQGAQQAAVLATVLYAVRNVAHVLAAIAVGSLSERVGRNRMLVAGYALGVATMLGFVLAFVIGANLAAVAILFVMAGAYLAVEETLEPTLTADMVPDENLRGTAFGLLGVVNGVGDFIASAVVGLIWWFNPAFGFAFAAAAMAIGAVLTSLCPRGSVR
jgi:MFS family permease